MQRVKNWLPGRGAITNKDHRFFLQPHLTVDEWARRGVILLIAPEIVALSLRVSAAGGPGVCLLKCLASSHLALITSARGVTTLSDALTNIV